MNKSTHTKEEAIDELVEMADSLNKIYAKNGRPRFIIPNSMPEVLVMNETQLLQYAAKAAFGEFSQQMIESGWNPLYPGDDALSLAVDLKFNIIVHWNIEGEPVAVSAGIKDERVCENFKDHHDENTAARYAIVRAAAEVEKQNLNQMEKTS